MAVLSVGEKEISAKAVIFDKDGTLILFEPLWLEVAKTRCREIVRALQVDGERETVISRRLLQTMGINPDTLRIHPRGPLAIAPRSEDMLAVTTGLFLQGYNWDEAREIVHRGYDQADRLVDKIALVQPVEGLEGIFSALRAAGLKIAIASTDVYTGIEATLKKLGIAVYVDCIVSGDRTPRHKPAPDMVLLACEALGVEPAEAVMVGDAPVDMIMGRKAGVCAAIGVLTGLTPREQLAPLADVVLSSIAEIAVCRSGTPSDGERETRNQADVQELMLYTDGGSRGNPGPAGIGAAIYRGETLVAEIGEYIGETTNNIAEYRALIRGLEECRRLGGTRIKAFADSELLVKQLNGQYKVKNAGLLPLFQEVQWLIKGFAAFSIAHVLRGKNKVADALANKGMDARK
ncbi:MAG TPA: HAD-IA family hydrolase [Negativicutes bacterium]|nr:HAD-IA family hydrolase [Negativicutes bacterium]